MTKISVIIPVYNSMPYIRQCLYSVCNQTFDDFEIICVDDGSSDESYSVLKLYSSQYDYVKVVQQSNLGQGIARNRGVSLARGEYIKFVDADDYLHPNALRLLYDNARNSTADIVVCKAFCVDESGMDVTPLKMWNHLIGCYSKYQLSNMDFFNNTCSPVLWDKLIKAKIAKSCMSPSVRRGQDFLTLIKYLSVSKLVCFIDERLYYYRHHSTSVMATPESRETIMTDFTTEQMAIKLMTEYFFSTKAYDYYCQRIQREWKERIFLNRHLLNNTDLTMMENFISRFRIESPMIL